MNSLSRPSRGVISRLFSDLNSYHQASDDLLENLTERLEDAIQHENTDILLNNGVLTIKIDDNNTYVINKQTPNRQIWLSSPVSGPRRFDFANGCWVDRDKTELKQLLSNELSVLLKTPIKC